jgi:hypothetical protein
MDRDRWWNAFVLVLGTAGVLVLIWLFLYFSGVTP